jgi:hydroxymethylglutaryl-CoA lyase
MKRIILYEMLMRDGLQSFSKILNFEEKCELLNILNSSNIKYVEFGSTTSPKLIPQIAYSYDLWDYIKKNTLYNKCIYTMLVTNDVGLKNTINLNIPSISIVCSVSDYFSLSNLHKNAIESFDVAYKYLEALNTTKHIRVYISCALGSCWEDFDEKYIELLVNNIKKLHKYATKNNISHSSFDIVLCDTIGINNVKNLEIILNKINNEDVFNYIALHFHSDGNFKKLIDCSLQYNIIKFDTSILGIGGCPFAKTKILGNISTLDLVKYLHSKNYTTDLSIEETEQLESLVKSILY